MVGVEVAFEHIEADTQAEGEVRRVDGGVQVAVENIEADVSAVVEVLELIEAQDLHLGIHLCVICTQSQVEAEGLTEEVVACLLGGLHLCNHLYGCCPQKNHGHGRSRLSPHPQPQPRLLQLGPHRWSQPVLFPKPSQQHQLHPGEVPLKHPHLPRLLQTIP